jgi:hypothetical protein
MQRSLEKLYKQYGTPVYVRFELALQHVILDIKDWQQELKELWAVLVKSDTSGIYELPIDHGISCRCCSKIIQESYTHPTLGESKREDAAQDSSLNFLSRGSRILKIVPYLLSGLY